MVVTNSNVELSYIPYREKFLRRYVLSHHPEWGIVKRDVDFIPWWAMQGLIVDLYKET